MLSALNQDTLSADAPACRKTGVARQDDALFLFGDAEDCVVFKNIRIYDVEAKDPRPSCEFADHDIRNELDIRHYIRRGIWMPIMSSAFVRDSRTMSTTRR